MVRRFDHVTSVVRDVGAAKNQARQALLLWRQIAALALVVTIATPLMLAFSTPARAHCEVGNRIFTATITFDDPCVQDELALPTIAGFKNGDNPSADELAISGDYSKTITENLGVSVGERWIYLKAPGTRRRNSAPQAEAHLSPALHEWQIVQQVLPRR
jgi:hypothetical protein